MKKNSAKSVSYDLFAEFGEDSIRLVDVSSPEAPEAPETKSESDVLIGNTIDPASERMADLGSSPAEDDRITSQKKGRYPAKVTKKKGLTNPLISVEFSKIAATVDKIEDGFLGKKSINALIDADVDTDHIEDFTQLYPFKTTKDGKHYRLVLNTPLFELLRVVSYSGNVYVELVKPSIVERYKKTEETPFYHLISRFSFRKEAAKKSFGKDNWELYFKRAYSSKLAADILDFSWETFWRK